MAPATSPKVQILAEDPVLREATEDVDAAMEGLVAEAAEEVKAAELEEAESHTTMNSLGTRVTTRKNSPSPMTTTPQPPDKEVEQKENALIRRGEEFSLSGLSLDDFTLPSRPSYGTKGRPVVLRTNYFQMISRPGAVIYRYIVEIVPQIKSPTGNVNRRKTRRLIQLLIANDRILQGAGIATDFGKIFLTAQKLPIEDKITLFQKFFEPEDEGPRPNATNHKITLQPDGAIPVQDLLNFVSNPPGTTSAGFDKAEILQALNVIVTRTAGTTPDIYGGGNRNKFYNHPHDENAGFPLGRGLIALKGFYTSVRTSTLRMLININVANAAFYPCINLLGLIRLYNPNSANDARSGVETFIKRLKVSHKYIRKRKDDANSVMKRVKTIEGFSHPHKGDREMPLLGNSQQIKFACPEIQTSGKITVEQYFLRKYNIRLARPNEPCINLGNKENPVFVPPELLWVEPGQQYNRKLSPDQTSGMIEFAVRTPAENARRIVNQGAAMMGLSEQNSNLLAFGLKVIPKMMTISGRILPPVSIQYKEKNAPKSFMPERGSWDLIGKSFMEGRPLRSWTYLKFADNDIGRADVEAFMTITRNSGLTCDNPMHRDGIYIPLGVDEDANDQTIRSNIETAATKGIKVLLVFLRDDNAFIYSRVKYWADVKYGIHTICSVGTKIRRRPGKPRPGEARQVIGPGMVDPNTAANIAKKFNLKLGGLNQVLPRDKLGYLQDGKTMLMGMDVTHPSPGSIEDAPSIAGVVASIDGRYGQWPASLRAQTSRKEMIEKLDEMFGERLDLWRKHNQGNLPERIVIYRDGVSEGQYRTLLQEELPQMRKACQVRYSRGKQPKVSIIVCGKRHHTRLYATNTKDANPRTGNPHNGTIVDRGVTMEHGWDFFLIAHHAIHGTARPTHYVVILDENAMNADGLESMTHSLCYLFGRATKAVSLCPPAYYADVLCERGRMYLYREFNVSDRGTVTSGAKFDWNRAPWLRDVHPTLQDTMFYI
ncbi:MAG: hypothetical protein Q9222_001042 [Ikaeria aurantiellina]